MQRYLEDLPHARVGPGLAGVAPGETGDDASPRRRDRAGAITPAVHAAVEAAASGRQAGARPGASSARRGWSGHGQHGDRGGSRHGCDATRQPTGERSWMGNGLELDGARRYPDQTGPVGCQRLFIFGPNHYYRPISNLVEGFRMR
jgi:hypothetical protein